jgi:predicted phage terminase large subunit-like protein
MTPMLTIRLHRRGPALWPEVFALKMLRKLLAALGSALFGTVYQGEPAPAGGSIFHAEWFHAYTGLPDLEEVGQAWDTALKGGDGHDYSCCVTGGRDRDGVIYLLDCWRGQVEAPELKRRIVEQYERWHPRWVLVEDAGAGAVLLPQIRARYALPLIAVRADRQKQLRAAAITPAVEGGLVRLPEVAPWKEDLLAELLAFPGGRHDDQVDAFTYLVTRLFTRGNTVGLAQWRTLRKPDAW